MVFTTFAFWFGSKYSAYHSLTPKQNQAMEAHGCLTVVNMLAFSDDWHLIYLITLFIEFKTLNYFAQFYILPTAKLANMVQLQVYNSGNSF